MRGLTIDHHYTSAFGAVLDDEIRGAIRAGMSLEALYCELSQRTREIGNVIAAAYLQAEERKCGG